MSVNAKRSGSLTTNGALSTPLNLGDTFALNLGAASGVTFTVNLWRQDKTDAAPVSYLVKQYTNASTEVVVDATGRQHVADKGEGGGDMEYWLERVTASANVDYWLGR